MGKSTLKVNQTTDLSLPLNCPSNNPKYNMQKVLTIAKPIGMTPLEVIKKIKRIKPELLNIKMSYAGRLDPLAHGVLLLLLDKETTHRDKYLALPKTYEFEVIFGLQTDTYDLLGLLAERKVKSPTLNVNLFVNEYVNNHIGKFTQQYPPYSSKPVNGHPLFWWARNDKLSTITIPTRTIEIYEFTCLEIGMMQLNKLQQHIKETIYLVQGDFRQESIMKRWDAFFSHSQNKKLSLPTAKFRIRCSSGTYIRELVHQLGEEMGCGAVALDILRTTVGDYSLKEALKLLS